MASFNDLPRDVLWLIFREVIIGKIIYESLQIYESDRGCGVGNPFVFYGYIERTRNLSLINKQSLKLVKSKCFKKGVRWWFIKGALTQKYK